MTRHSIKSALIACLAFALIGCGSEDATPTSCGQGIPRVVNGQTYCLYQNNLIIEGFDCPGDMIIHDVPGGKVCSPGGPLPSDLEDPFDPTTPWCLENCDMIDITIRPPSPATPSSFQTIARYKDYGCVIDDNNKATCWGDPFEPAGRFAMLSKTYDNVLTMALDKNYFCSLSTAGAISCQGIPGTVPADFDTQQTYSAISTAEEAVCALGDASPPFDALSCRIAQAKSTPISSVFEQNAQLGLSFKTLSISDSFVDNSNIGACLITPLDNALCAGTNGTFEVQGPFKEVNAHGNVVACALSYTDAVSCWDMNTTLPLPAPAGTFKELHGAYCGLLDTDKVVCWPTLTQSTPMGSTVPLTTIFDEHPRAFHLTRDRQASTNEFHWCAVRDNGDIRCSDFPNPG